MNLSKKVLENSGSWQGKITGIPNASHSTAFCIYRTDLMPDGIPDTWEKYREAAKAQTKPDEGVYGISVSATTASLAVCLTMCSGPWADPGRMRTGT